MYKGVRNRNLLELSRLSSHYRSLARVLGTEMKWSRHIINTLRQRQNACHFADYFQIHFLQLRLLYFDSDSPEPKCPIYNELALIKIINGLASNRRRASIWTSDVRCSFLTHMSFDLDVFVSCCWMRFDLYLIYFLWKNLHRCCTCIGDKYNQYLLMHFVFYINALIYPYSVLYFCARMDKYRNHHIRCLVMTKLFWGPYQIKTYPATSLRSSHAWFHNWRIQVRNEKNWQIFLCSAIWDNKIP